MLSHRWVCTGKTAILSPCEDSTLSQVLSLMSFTYPGAEFHSSPTLRKGDGLEQPVVFPPLLTLQVQLI